MCANGIFDLIFLSLVYVFRCMQNQAATTYFKAALHELKARLVAHLNAKGKTIK